MIYPLCSKRVNHITLTSDDNLFLTNPDDVYLVVALELLTANVSTPPTVPITLAGARMTSTMLSEPLMVVWVLVHHLENEESVIKVQ